MRLPAGEPMGLLGLSTTTHLGPFFLGPALFGAAQGRRGGFFTFGLEGGLRGRPSGSPALELELGCFLGGGGGGSAPQGGGLMVRPHLDARLPLGPVKLGLGWSHIRFPNGEIDSSQVAFSIAYDTNRLWLPTGSWGAPYAGGLTWEPRTMSLEWLQVTPQPKTLDRVGAPQAAFALAGFRLTHAIFGPWFRYVGLHGAVQGRSPGYAHVLVGAGFHLPMAGPVALEGTVGVGLGGGGNLEARGGLLGFTEVLVSAGTRTWQAGAGLGFLRVAGGGFSGRTLTVRLSHPFEAALPGGEHSRSIPADAAWRVGTGLLHYGITARTDGSRSALRMLTLDLDRLLTDAWYLHGEAATATSGGAGGYATGLVGLGVQTPAWRGQRAFLEASLGAGGGGGVATGGVLLTSLKAGWRLVLSRGMGIRTTLGRVEAPHGRLASTTFALGFDLGFSILTR